MERLSSKAIDGVDGYRRRSVTRVIVSSGPADCEIIEEAIELAHARAKLGSHGDKDITKLWQLLMEVKRKIVVK